MQLYNYFVLSTLLPPHELRKDILREKEYISENLQKIIFLKIWTTFILPHLILKIWTTSKIAMKLFKFIST